METGDINVIKSRSDSIGNEDKWSGYVLAPFYLVVRNDDRRRGPA